MIEGQTGVRIISVQGEGLVDSWVNSLHKLIGYFSIFVEKEKALNGVESGDSEDEKA